MEKSRCSVCHLFENLNGLFLKKKEQALPLNDSLFLFHFFFYLFFSLLFFLNFVQFERNHSMTLRYHQNNPLKDYP